MKKHPNNLLHTILRVLVLGAFLVPSFAFASIVTTPASGNGTNISVNITDSGNVCLAFTTTDPTASGHATLIVNGTGGLHSAQLTAPTTVTVDLSAVYAHYSLAYPTSGTYTVTFFDKASTNCTNATSPVSTAVFNQTFTTGTFNTTMTSTLVVGSVNDLGSFAVPVIINVLVLLMSLLGIGLGTRYIYKYLTGRRFDGSDYDDAARSLFDNEEDYIYWEETGRM